MRFRTPPTPRLPPLAAFATDLDRTLLRPGGRPTAAARRALRVARSMGLRTVLVSGREYPVLRRMARDFGTWDALVAEDGAVVEAPYGSPPRAVGRRTAAELRRRLARHPRLEGQWGEVVFSAHVGHRRRLVGIVAGLPVHTTTNVDRLMVIPAGVSKRTGLERALRRLGVGRRRYAAIGDAENDVEMLRAAAISGTVGNGRPEARRVADYVARGSFDRGVWEFVDGPVRAWMEAAVPTDGRRGPGRAPR
jgi:hydroxymethylpyrimidine pyrophosphatase-like HAD family hydrolase